MFPFVVNAPLRAAAIPCSSVSAHLLWLPSRDSGAEPQATDRPVPPAPPSCRVMFGFAAGVAVVQGASSQSDTESIASPTAALKRDLAAVEARVLAERRARVEAEVPRITLPQKTYAEFIPKKKNCSCIDK